MVKNETASIRGCMHAGEKEEKLQFCAYLLTPRRQNNRTIEQHTHIHIETHTHNEESRREKRSIHTKLSYDNTKKFIYM